MKWILVIAWAVVGVSEPARAGLPDDVAVGTRVELKGTYSGSEVAAEKIELQRTARGSDQIEGAIEQVDAAARSLLVAGVRVVLDPGAVVRDGDGREIDFAGVAPGQEAEAAGRFADGVLRAVSLEVDDLEGEDPRDVEIGGVVSERDPAGNGFRVLGIRVLVTPRTQVKFD